MMVMGSLVLSFPLKDEIVSKEARDFSTRRIFPFKIFFFGNLIEFSMTKKLLKIQYLLHLRLLKKKFKSLSLNSTH